MDGLKDECTVCRYMYVQMDRLVDRGTVEQMDGWLDGIYINI